jgi:N-acetylmuramoyl-L-alanine amidase
VNRRGHRPGRRAVIAAALALLAASCSSEGGGGGEATSDTDGATTVQETAPPTTEAPSTTEAPPTTAASPPTTATANTGPGALVTPKGVVVPVLERTAAGGWQVRTPCGRTATVTGGTPVPSAMVVLDPGHGGNDPGARSPDGSLAEAPLNLEVSRHAQAALEAAGVPVLLTRTGTHEVALATRAEIARSLGPRAFVSIHHNAEPDGPMAGPGSETYYQIGSPDSKRLAGLIQEEVVRALSAYRVAWVGDRDAGAKYRPGTRGDYYAMLRLPQPVVSALAELAFISNPPEAELLARPEVQQVEGRAVARGILRYLTTNDPGSGFVEPYPRTDPPGAGGASQPCVDPPL